MNSKRLDFEIRAVFLKQLLSFEGRIFEQTYCSKDWDGKNYIYPKIFLNKVMHCQSKIPTLIHNLSKWPSRQITNLPKPIQIKKKLPGKKT